MWRTSLADPVAFDAERYLDSHGAVIMSATSQGQYASRGFGDPDFAGSSGPNAYAPGPISVATGTNTTTWVTFLDLQEERPVRELVRRNQRRMVTLTGGIRGRSLDDVWEDKGGKKL